MRITVQIHVRACWKNLTFPNYEFGKGQYAFYHLKLSRFGEKNKVFNTQVSQGRILTNWLKRLSTNKRSTFLKIFTWLPSQSTMSCSASHRGNHGSDVASPEATKTFAGQPEILRHPVDAQFFFVCFIICEMFCQILPYLNPSDEASFSSVNLIGRFSKFIRIMLSEALERETNMQRPMNFSCNDSPRRDVLWAWLFFEARTIFGSDLINHLRTDTVYCAVNLRHLMSEKIARL